MINIFLAILAVTGFFVLVLALQTIRKGTFTPADGIALSARKAIDATAAAERLAGAIRIPTLSDRDAQLYDGNSFLELHAYLEKCFPLVHKELHCEKVSEFSLLYTWKADTADLKPVMLTSHLDVVPVEEGTEANWTHPPFSGAIDAGYVWGRGAMDVQEGVMGILEAVEHLLSMGFRPARTLYIGFGHDEESDGDQGAVQIAKLLEDRGVRLEWLLDEGTPIVHNMLPQMNAPVALVAVAEKGYLSLRLKVTAEGGHSSVPQGTTSIARLGEALATLENRPVKGRMDGLVRETLQSMGPAMSLGFRMVMANLWLFRGIVKRILSAMPATRAAMTTTTATTLFNAGIKENVLPVQASAVVNFRIHPNDSVQGILKHVNKRLGSRRVTVEPLPGSIEPSQVSDTRHPAYSLLRNTIQEVFPEVIVAPTLMIGATDARHYATLTDNVYRFMPLRADESDLDRVHGTDERISIDNYHEIIVFYMRLIENSSSHSALNDGFHADV